MRYIKESSTREMFYKRAGHAEISENLIYSKIVSLFKNELIFGNWVTTPKLDVESFILFLVVCRGLILSFAYLSIFSSSFYILPSISSNSWLWVYFILFFCRNHTRFKDCFREMFSNKAIVLKSVLIEYIEMISSSWI